MDAKQNTLGDRQAQQCLVFQAQPDGFDRRSAGKARQVAQRMLIALGAGAETPIDTQPGIAGGKD
jgi:hypothetical protein